MTQINPLINLPSASSVLNFKYQDKHLSDHSLSHISIPSINQFMPSLHDSSHIPQFFPNDNLSKRLSFTDLGNPVVKKVKKSPETSSSIAIPSLKLNNHNPFTQDSYQLDKFSMITVVEPIQVTFSEDGKMVRVNEEFPEIYSKSSAKGSFSKMKGSKLKEISVDSKKNVPTEIKVDIFAKKPSQKGASQDLWKKELSKKEKDLPQINTNFNYKIEEDMREVHLSLNTLPSTNVSSPALPIQGNFHIPKLLEPKPEALSRQNSNSMQNALQSLEQRMLFKPQSKLEPLESSQPALFQNEEALLGGLINNLLQGYLTENLNNQLQAQSMLNMKAVNELAAQNLLSQLLSTNFNTSPILSLLDLYGNELLSANFEQVPSQKAPQKDLNTMANTIETEKVDKKAKLTATSKSVSDSSLSTTSGSSKSDEEKEKKKTNPVRIEVQKTAEIKKVSQGKVQVVQEVKEKEDKKVFKAEKVASKVIRKQIRPKEDVKDNKKKRVVLMNRWSMVSKRRENRWQQGRNDKVTKPSGFKRATKGSSKGVYFINLHGEDIFETPVGPKHQVKKLPLKPQKTPNPRRELPQLKWNPDTLKKARLESYFKKLGEMLQMDVNQEKAIKLLQEEGNDPKKVFKRVEGKEKEYIRDFTVKQRRRIEGKKDYAAIFLLN